MDVLDLSNLDVLLMGQAIMGRTETLENYLMNRTRLLGVLAITQVFSKKNLSRYSLYEKGEKLKEFAIPSIVLKGHVSYKLPLLLPVYIFHVFLITFSILRLKRKFLLFIGIGTFPALMGILFRKLGIVKQVVYYSLDYFPPDVSFGFNRLLVRIFVVLDRFLARSSDIGWLISPRIIEAREEFAKFRTEEHKNLIVPLGFNASLLRDVPFEKIDKNTIVFVGSTGHYHGLQLLLDSIKSIIKKIPAIKVKIIGPGPWDSLQKYISENNLEDYFTIRGFIENNDELFDEVSKCALGLAIYAPLPDNPTIYADPGKPKLYAFCGLPIVISKVPSVAKEIDSRKAGIAIDYNNESFISAIEKILSDEENLKLYRRNALAFAKDYVSEKMFDIALRNSFAITGIN